MQNFVPEKFLGKGSYGAVILARRKLDQQLYAIKQINLANLPRVDRDAQLTEIRILSQIYHPNIVKIYEAFVQDKKINMVLEYASLGDLDKEIQRHIQLRQAFPEDRIWKVLLQILAGLRALHNQNVLHRDIKGQNILCFANDIVKIADFGVSKVLKKGQFAHTGIGTPYFISPEVWANGDYDAKCDVFSLGCLIYEMCALGFPFRGRDMQALGRVICRGEYQPLSTKYSQDLRTLVDKMLLKDAKKRYSVQQLIDSDEVQRRLSICPTTLEEHILPGLGTQRQVFNVGYSEQLGSTIQYDKTVQNALLGQNSDAMLLNEQYDKLRQLRQMAEFQQHRSKVERENEVSSAFQRQIDYLEQKSHHRDPSPASQIQLNAPQEIVINAKPAEEAAAYNPQHPQAYQQQRGQERQQPARYPANYPVLQRPPQVLQKAEEQRNPYEGGQAFSQEQLKQHEQRGQYFEPERYQDQKLQNLPAVRSTARRFACAQNSAPSALCPASNARFQILRPRPIVQTKDEGLRWRDPQAAFAARYEEQRRNRSDWRDFY